MKAAQGKYTTNGKPHGYSSISPFLALANPVAALDFYETVFGAKRRGVMEMEQDGQKQVAHAELDFGDCILQLGLASPAYGLQAPSGTTVSYSLAVYVSDVDATVKLATDHGATLREGPVDFTSGDRYASVLDPFGVRWSIMTRIEDLSPEESHRRILAFFGAGAS